MDYELLQPCNKIFRFFGHENRQMTKFFSVDRSTNHSPCFLLQQETFLQPIEVQVLGLLLQDNAEYYVTFKLVYFT
jgi:hypothetical protein